MPLIWRTQNGRASRAAVSTDHRVSQRASERCRDENLPIAVEPRRRSGKVNFPDPDF